MASRKIKINSDATTVTYLLVSDDKECRSIEKDIQEIKSDVGITRFKLKWGYKPSDIVIYGSTNVVSKSMVEREQTKKILSAVLPQPTRMKEHGRNQSKTVWKCFCCEAINYIDAYHKTPLHSWQCLMARIGKPSHCIILRININSEKEDKDGSKDD